MNRQLDPLTTNLVVADVQRTEKTICLAVSPSLKAHGISGRPRLFEVTEAVRQVNALRLARAPGRRFSGESCDSTALHADPSLRLAFSTATPRMARYIECSTQIYDRYLHYVAPEDIHVYSIDEVFIDVTKYLRTYRCSAYELARRIIRDVLEHTGITATAGIGPNLYLCKVAMDIVAKHIPPDQDGVRIAVLDEQTYRQQLWSHRPLTDFWRVGRGISKKLEAHGLRTMGDIARCSVQQESLLYKLFGKNAELLIDHAWGWEPCTIAQIKAYRPSSSSLGSGQVLKRPYTFEEGQLIVREMADSLALDLVDKKLAADQLVLTVGYDAESLTDPNRRAAYTGPVTTDAYGRTTPKHAHGSANLDGYTSSAKRITAAAMALYSRTVQRELLLRRVTITANHVLPESSIPAPDSPQQLDLFTDSTTLAQQQAAEEAALNRERKMQQAVLHIKKKYGKNAILKGTSLREGATARERNRQIGGHHE